MKKLTPQAGDVVEYDGTNYMLREVQGGTGRISAGRTDPGTWVLTRKLVVVYREGS